MVRKLLCWFGLHTREYTGVVQAFIEWSCPHCGKRKYRIPRQCVNCRNRYMPEYDIVYWCKVNPIYPCTEKNKRNNCNQLERI